MPQVIYGSAPSAEFVAFVRDLIASEVPPFAGQDINIQVQRFESRESSDVGRLRVTTSCGLRHVFAKVLKPRDNSDAEGQHPRRQFDREVEWANRAWDAFESIPGMSIARPIAWDPQRLGIATEEAPGAALDTVIGRTAVRAFQGVRFEFLKRKLADVGRWVRIFQQRLTDADAGFVDLAELREYTDVRLRKITQYPQARFGESERTAVLNRFDQQALCIRPSELARVAAHGDMTPSNVFVAPSGLTILDFGKATHDGRYVDIARLYTQLDFLTAKPQYPVRVIRHLQRALLDGFDPQLQIDNPLFTLYIVQHIVCHFLSHLRSPGRFPASLYSRHLCRTHRQWLRAWACPESRPPVVGAAVAGDRA